VKILGLSCSPRKSGNTEILVSEALNGARSEGAEIELFSLSGKDIEPCDGCYACRTTGKCHINDDMQAAYQKLSEADGIVFGTPIYYYSLTGQAKVFIDRTYAFGHSPKGLANKVGGIIAVAATIGLIDAIKDLYFFFAIKHMVAADYVAAYASKKGAIKENERAMKAAWELGREMAQLVMKRFEFPKEFESGLTTYVSEKYKL